jgi:hypothetical protein
MDGVILHLPCSSSTSETAVPYVRLLTAGLHSSVSPEPRSLPSIGYQSLIPLVVLLTETLLNFQYLKSLIHRLNSIGVQLQQFCRSSPIQHSQLDQILNKITSYLAYGSTIRIKCLQSQSMVTWNSLIACISCWSAAGSRRAVMTAVTTMAGILASNSFIRASAFLRLLMMS